MARFISNSKTLLRLATASSQSLPCMTLSLRHRSSHPTNQLIEIELSSSPPSSGDYDISLQLFDDIIQRILVKKATPDWLPFVPGSSFWVPPRPSPSHYVDMFHKFTDDISGNETISLATLQGCPSSKYFIQEDEWAHGEDTGMELNIPEGMVEGTTKVKVLTISENVAQSEDEEG